MARLLASAGITTCIIAGACQERSVQVKLDGAVKTTDIREGKGMEAEEGSAVAVAYRGYLPDGEVLVDTYRDNKVHKFVIGDGTVIPGLDRAVRGMKEGGMRKATLPPTSHYGRKGYAGVVPPDTMLEFEIELVEVRGSWN